MPKHSKVSPKSTRKKETWKSQNPKKSQKQPRKMETNAKKHSSAHLKSKKVEKVRFKKASHRQIVCGLNVKDFESLQEFFIQNSRVWRGDKYEVFCREEDAEEDLGSNGSFRYSEHVSVMERLTHLESVQKFPLFPPSSPRDDQNKENVKTRIPQSSDEKVKFKDLLAFSRGRLEEDRREVKGRFIDIEVWEELSRKLVKSRESKEEKEKRRDPPPPLPVSESFELEGQYARELLKLGVDQSRRSSRLVHRSLVLSASNRPLRKTRMEREGRGGEGGEGGR